jgi:hypothetical protein
MQAEIQRLKIEVITPRVSPIPAMKDVSLVAGIKEWTGKQRSDCTEFFAQIDTYAT